MDHKEVIPDSHQEYDDEFEESEDENDKAEDDKEEDDEEEEEDSETTGSEPVYTALLPDHEEDLVEEVEVDDMESVEDEEVATSTPLLQYHFSKEEKQGGELVGVEKNRGGEGWEAREMLDQGEDENDKELLDLVLPFVSIVITQPTPELERKTREGCLEENHHDEEEDDEMSAAELDDDHDKENTSSSNQHESCSMGGVPSIIVTPVTPELSQKVFESDQDVEVESEEEEEKAKIDNNENIVEEARDNSEKIKIKGGIRFSQDSKQEEEDKSNGNGKERLRRRSSLFSSVSKATTILRCATTYLRVILVFGPTFSISIFTSCFPSGDQ